MKREKAYMSEDALQAEEILHGSKNNDWVYITEETVGINLGKHIEEIKVILQRKQDNKYFQFRYARTDQHRLDEGGLNKNWPIEGEEVFQKVVTKTIYE